MSKSDVKIKIGLEDAELFQAILKNENLLKKFAENQGKNFADVEKSAKASLKQVETALNRTGAEAAKVGERIQKSSGHGSFALMSLARVGQDLPYALKGNFGAVANNLEQVVFSMGLLAQSSKETGGLMKTLASTIMSPTGVLFALSLIPSAILIITDLMKEGKTTTEEYKNALGSVFSISGDIDKLTATLEQTKLIRDELLAKEPNAPLVTGPMAASPVMSFYEKLPFHIKEATREKTEQEKQDEAILEHLNKQIEAQELKLAIAKRLKELGAEEVANAEKVVKFVVLRNLRAFKKMTQAEYEKKYGSSVPKSGTGYVEVPEVIPIEEESTLQLQLWYDFMVSLEMTGENFASSMSSALVYGEDLGDALKSAAKTFMQMMIQAIMMRGVEALLNIILPRATGGDMYAGRPYMVGEQGPELVLPKNNGMVVSNNQLQAAMNSMGGGLDYDRLALSLASALPNNFVIDRSTLSEYTGQSNNYRSRLVGNL